MFSQEPTRFQSELQTRQPIAKVETLKVGLLQDIRNGRREWQAMIGKGLEGFGNRACVVVFSYLLFLRRMIIKPLLVDFDYIAR